jgi:hypothetical protein
MKVANIPTSLRKFFHSWMVVTRPMHKLGATEQSVLAELLYFRYQLGLHVTDDSLLDKLLFDYETRTKICDYIGINKSRLNLVLTKLRKEGIMYKRTINKQYIPELSPKDTEFILAYKFIITKENNGSDEEKSTDNIPKDSSETQDNKQ